MRDKIGFLERALQAIVGLAGGVSGLLIVRFLFRLLIANPQNPVVPWVYSLSRPFLLPWTLFWPLSETPGLVVEKPTLVALSLYAVIGVGLGYLRHAIEHSRANPLPQHRPTVGGKAK